MGCGASAARLVDAPREADQLASEEIASKEHAAGAVEGRRDTSLEEELPLIQTAAAAPDFAKLITEPPQQKLELSDTNKCTQRQTACIPLCRVRCVCRRLTRRLPAAADSWAGATEAQERDLYKAMFRLFQKRLGEALCGVLREKSHPHLLPYIAGNVPLNYYLRHNFNAPAPIPSNDLDIKVEFGEHMRTMLAAKGGGPPKNKPDKATWTEEETAVVRHPTTSAPVNNAKLPADSQPFLCQFKGCFDESLATFVTYAGELMEAFKEAAAAMTEQFRDELKPLGISIGEKGVHAYHKTHAAPKGDNPPLHLVPLSGGVFQLMCELTPPAGAVGAENFIWNLVDLEADWKSATIDGEAFPTTAVPADAPDQERGLRLLAPDELRKDLDGEYQEVKQQRRQFKRDYWDWAAKAHTDGGDPPAWGAALPAECTWP